MRVITANKKDYKGVFVLVPEGRNEVNGIEISIRKVKNYPELTDSLLDVAARAVEKALRMEIELISARERQANG